MVPYFCALATQFPRQTYGHSPNVMVPCQVVRSRDGPKFGRMFGSVRLGNMWLSDKFSQTSAKILRQLWQCISRVLHSPLTLTWSYYTYYYTNIPVGLQLTCCMLQKKPTMCSFILCTRKKGATDFLVSLHTDNTDSPKWIWHCFRFRQIDTPTFSSGVTLASRGPTFRIGVLINRSPTFKLWNNG